MQINIFDALGFNRANRKITVFVLVKDASLRILLLLCFLNCSVVWNLLALIYVN